MNGSDREDALPTVTVSVSPVISMESTVSEIDDIRPLLSPIVSEPDDLNKDHTTMDKMLLTPGEDRDDFLLRSLKSMSFLNATSKWNSRASLLSSKNSLKMYRDNPDETASQAATPYIFAPNSSKILTSALSLNRSRVGLPDASQTSQRANPNTGGPGSNPPSRHGSITESIVSEVQYLKNFTVAQLKRRRFLVVSIFSLLCMCIFNLIFLPRTSLDRDLRRLYGGVLTFDDVSRMFLNQLHYRSHTETYLDIYNTNMHYSGGDYKSSETLMKGFSNLDTRVESYEVFMSTPIKMELKLLDDQSGNVVFEPSLKEGDEISYYPYSASGAVNSKFVYVNYGLNEDYGKLAENSVDVQDKIFIIRVRNIHPSLLVELAQEHGAKAVLFYKDPYDDGKFTEKNGYMDFPLGYARSYHAIDKYTGNFIYRQPGDPTTPGWSPYLFDNYKRLENPDTIPKIPIVPISFTEIQPILKRINKIGPSLDWNGDILDFDYRPGPSEDFTLSLNTRMEAGVKPVHNIITTIPGIMADEEIIIGASRDVIGGHGGVSNGEISLVEMARGFDELFKRGWKPLRTIKLISWDGSSMGLLGSTEYGEYHAQKLVNNCIVYINLDHVRGNVLSIDANPLFNRVIGQVMKLIAVDNSETLDDRFSYHNGTINLIGERVNDYSVFQNHLGIPSINIGFVADKTTDPVGYHNSRYDNSQLLKSFDPHVRLHGLLAQFVGMLAIELSEHEILNVHSSDYMRLIDTEFSCLQESIPETWLAENLSYPFEFRQVKEEASQIHSELAKLLKKAHRFDRKLEQLQVQIVQDYPWFKLYKKIQTSFEIKIYNAKVKAIDRMFISVLKENQAGDENSLLFRRPWFRHLIFAPPLPGTEARLLPGLWEAVASHDFPQFQLNLVTLHMTLTRLRLAL